MNLSTPHNLSVNKMTLDTVSMAGSDVARSTSTGTGGWYNTIPHSTSTLSKRSSRSKRSPFLKDSYDKDYMKKRNLILELLVSSFLNFRNIFGILKKYCNLFIMSIYWNWKKEKQTTSIKFNLNCYSIEFIFKMTVYIHYIINLTFRRTKKKYFINNINIKVLVKRIQITQLRDLCLLHDVHHSQRSNVASLFHINIELII